jgi:hypothetical protein
VSEARSIVGVTLGRGVSLVEAAWRDSLARRAWLATWSDPSSASRRRRVRWAAMSAAVTALAARSLSTSPLPYTWTVPAAALAVAVVFSLVGDSVD